MNRWLTLSCLLLSLAAWSPAQDQSPAPQTPSSSSSTAAANSPSEGTAIAVELTKSLDSRKLKPGDEVVARTTMAYQQANGEMVPRGSRVIGQVTESKSRSKGDAESTLGINFQKIEGRDGKVMPLRATIQAVAPPVVSAMSMNNGNSPMNTGGPPMPGSPTGTNPMGGNMPTMPGSSPTMPGNPSAGNPGGYGGTASHPQSGTQNGPGPLSTQANGVVGIRDLQLGSNSVLTSGGKNLKLDGGTQMILRVQSE
jgi:hypothetical protein